ncbi:MAG: outer membrane protein assembly factor BamB [Gammaproteobacteria bacterium]|nr:outer membrane protein assembly factor BamB [Gammaproteobacteria bacterium]
MNMTRLAAIALLAMLTGCSTISDWFDSKKNTPEPAKLVDFKPRAAFEVRWHESIGDMGNGELTPALTQDAVFVANAEGKVFRLQRSNGKQVWKIDSGFTISGGVGAGDGLVLVGGDKGEVAAYDEDGKLRWKTTVSSEVLSAPQAADGMVVVRTGDGHVAGLSETDGKRQWLYERPTPALIVRNHAPVVISHGVAFAGFAAGKLAAIAVSNGSVRWETTVSQPRGSTELERISDIVSMPVVDDQQVCAVSFQGRVGCFDAAQGSSLWSRDLSSDKGLTMLRRNLYVTDAQGSIQALDKSSGSSVWKNDQLFMRETSAPVALGDFVVVGDFEGYLHALSRNDGAMMARIDTDGSPILTAPLEMDGGLLVQTQNGGLYSVAIH